MRKKLFAILFLILCTMHVGAQDKSTLLQRINNIKNQSEIYYWDQFTHTDADTSKVNATKRLLIDVNIQRGEDQKLSVEEIMPHANYINIDRGNLKQCFVYIKKEKADVIKHGITTPTMVSEPAPILHEPNINTTTNNTQSTTISQPQRKFIPDAFVQRIMGVKKFRDAYKLLESMRAQGQVLQFGKLRDVSDYNPLNLILFDINSEEIITILSPVNAMGIRTNEVDGSEDSLENYPKNLTAVIWYLKK